VDVDGRGYLVVRDQENGVEVDGGVVLCCVGAR
jgi:hypothetical protein